jgi:hypothetical protein
MPGVCTGMQSSAQYLVLLASPQGAHACISLAKLSVVAIKSSAIRKTLSALTHQPLLLKTHIWSCRSNCRHVCHSHDATTVNQ